MATPVTVGLTAVILAVKNYEAQVLTIGEGEEFSLPNGAFDPVRHRTLELGLRSWVDEQTGVKLGYVEQLYTFGNRFRDPRPEVRDHRIVTVSYLALVGPDQAPQTPGGLWSPIYRFLPWEDHRGGPPQEKEKLIASLEDWRDEAQGEAREARSRRIMTLFPPENVPWDPEKAILRYELLYEAGLVAESHRDWTSCSPEERIQLPMAGSRLGKTEAWTEATQRGTPMTMDHRRILASALGRIRGKIRYRPVIFELVPPEFTLLHIQKVSESLTGIPLHKGNFRRLLIQDGLVKETDRKDTTQPGRPAALFRFRSSVLQERPAPGVGLPLRR